MSRQELRPFMKRGIGDRAALGTAYGAMWLGAFLIVALAIACRAAITFLVVAVIAGAICWLFTGQLDRDVAVTWGSVGAALGGFWGIIMALAAVAKSIK